LKPGCNLPLAWVAAGLAAAGLFLPACKRSKAKAPVVAASPGPALVPAASAEPLSTPQTAARLPPPQPIPAEAIPPEPEVEVAAAPPAPKTAPTKAPVRVLRQSVPAATGTAPANPATAVPAPEPPPSGPQLRPLLTPEMEREINRKVDLHLAAADRLLERLPSRPLDKEQSAAAGRVRAFIEQAQKARRQGDLVRANSLAERAELLATDLAKGK